MNLISLNERAKALQAELQRAKQAVSNLTEQLEQTKNHFNTVSGHFNEVVYLMEEEKKLELSKDKEPENDKTDEEDQEEYS